MTRPMQRIALVIASLLLSMLALSACGGSSSGSSGGADATLTGQVTKVDVAGKTFSVDAGGKAYDFKLVGGSTGDMAEIKKHMDTKEQIDVKYKGTTSPYDVVSAD